VYFEDLVAGQIFRGSREIVMERDRIVAFAREFDPHPGHVGEDTAADSAFGELVASGWHTASTASRLMTEALPVAGGGMGGSVEVRWLTPVRPGDALRVEIEVMSLRPSATRPHLGIVRMRTAILNQRDEEVATLNSTNFLPRRGAG